MVTDCIENTTPNKSCIVACVLVAVVVAFAELLPLRWVNAS
jgi:hypothetical protein